MSEPFTIYPPQCESVILSDGKKALILTDDDDVPRFASPIRRAVLVARLRALADAIEAAPPPSPLDCLARPLPR